MIQDDLWHDSLEDALRSVVEAVGGPKVVANAIWPSKSVIDAARLLNHCLDSERPEKLALEDLVVISRMGRESGFHTVMAFLSKALGYQDPQPVEPEDERAALERQFIESVEVQRRILDRIEKLPAVTLRQVSG
jgi:hypothetical protein